MPLISQEYQGYTADGINWACLAEFEFTALDRYFRISVGSTTDGPSIPSMLRSMISDAQWAKIWLPAVCHDAAYRFQLEEFVEGNWVTVGLDKNECDSMFLELMIDNGVEKVLANSVYEAVRVFGWKAFHNDRDENISES